MKQLHIGTSPLTGTIFAGTLLKNGKVWATGKQDVTREALIAAAEHVDKFGKTVEIRREDGTLEYRITVEKFSV
jgi:hypothetical protein